MPSKSLFLLIIYIYYIQNPKNSPLLLLFNYYSLQLSELFSFIIGIYRSLGLYKLKNKCIKFSLKIHVKSGWTGSR